jgi:thiamine-phosphate pyrophosphorylase
VTVMSEARQPDLFYPIVPDVAWLERLLPLAPRTVQLRLKDADDAEIGRQVRRAVLSSRGTGCQLIVNDHWRHAIAEGADFIHLGQEDLAAANLDAIKAAGLRLGVSTHDDAELEAALAAAPDYIALGPIYETKLKAMTWAPQGLERVTAWKAKIGALPLVAIGGITPERAPAVLAAGADSLAVITDFMTAPHPEARLRLWLDWVASVRP